MSQECGCDYSYTCPAHQAEIEVERQKLELEEFQKETTKKLDGLQEAVDTLIKICDKLAKRVYNEN
jgi:hypothetical protein